MLEDYLAAVAVRLPAGRHTRAEVLAELRDGLHEAAARHEARGMSAADATRAAVAEFGTPAVVARAFAGELATVRARHTLWAYLGTGPLVGVWWLLTVVPRPWSAGPAALLAGIPVLPLVAAAVLTALATLAATGRLTRWIPAASPHQALGAATGIALAAVAGDLTVLGGLAVHAATDRPVPATLAAVAVGASLVRLAASGPALYRLRRTRAAIA